MDTIRLQLTKGQSTIIDSSDLPIVADRLWQASPRRDGLGFYVTSSNGVRMHRFILGVKDRRIVDHIDGDGLNNRRLNLRIGTQALNCVNRRTTPGGGLRGTRLKDGRWQAYIKQNGKQDSLGCFSTQEEAHAAYLAEAKRRYGDWVPASLFCQDDLVQNWMELPRPTPPSEATPCPSP